MMTSSIGFPPDSLFGDVHSHTVPPTGLSSSLSVPKSGPRRCPRLVPPLSVCCGPLLHVPARSYIKATLFASKPQWEPEILYYEFNKVKMSHKALQKVRESPPSLYVDIWHWLSSMGCKTSHFIYMLYWKKPLHRKNWKIELQSRET